MGVLLRLQYLLYIFQSVFQKIRFLCKHVWLIFHSWIGLKLLELHILAFTETWLDNGNADGEISLPGYKMFRSDRINGKGGGIAVYVKESLSIIRRVDLEQQFPGECILLEILLPKANGILFGTFYRPPSQTDFMNLFRDVLESASAENKELIVTGF